MQVAENEKERTELEEKNKILKERAEEKIQKIKK